jgi:hypothetical protein
MDTSRMNEERHVLNVISEIMSGHIYHGMPVDHNRPSVLADVHSTVVEELEITGFLVDPWYISVGHDCGNSQWS